MRETIDQLYRRTPCDGACLGDGTHGFLCSRSRNGLLEKIMQEHGQEHFGHNAMLVFADGRIAGWACWQCDPDLFVDFHLEVVNEVKKHALAHYDEDGWDYVVEATTDGELAQEITQEVLWENKPELRWPTADEAIALIGKRYKIRDERRRDIVGLAD